MEMSVNHDFSLPEVFFEKNPMNGRTNTGHMSYFQMWTLYQPELENRVDEKMLPSFSEERRTALLEERAAIEALSNPEEIVRYMRKHIDMSNRNLLCRKAIEAGGEVSSLLVDMLAKNGLDVFIECAMLSLSRADEVYIDRVAEEFPAFRNSYARAAATILLAYREYTGSLKDVYDLYIDLRESADEEEQHLSETVLFAIYLLSGRLKNLQDDLAAMTGSADNRI